jgi:hypothetical protein
MVQLLQSCREFPLRIEAWRSRSAGAQTEVKQHRCQWNNEGFHPAIAA